MKKSNFIPLSEADESRFSEGEKIIISRNGKIIEGRFLYFTDSGVTVSVDGEKRNFSRNSVWKAPDFGSAPVDGVVNNISI